MKLNFQKALMMMAVLSAQSVVARADGYCDGRAAMYRVCSTIQHSGDRADCLDAVQSAAFVDRNVVGLVATVGSSALGYIRSVTVQSAVNHYFQKDAVAVCSRVVNDMLKKWCVEAIASRRFSWRTVVACNRSQAPVECFRNADSYPLGDCDDSYL